MQTPNSPIGDVREPAVAGTFYPADPAALDRVVRACLEGADAAPAAAKAIVGPHAGYVYSGPIAGTAYASVRHLADRVRRIVLLGPAHRYGFRGIAAPSAGGLRTPLGVVPVDRTGIAAILDLPGVQILDRAFDGEHGLEVHLPFIQRVFPDAAVVPLVVGEAPPGMVEAVLRALWGGPETLIVVSSDLSHFHDYETARALDHRASKAIEALHPERLDAGHACGFRPLAGLLLRARELDLRATTHDLRNSGDTAGDRSRVVGYGAYTLEPAEEARLSDEHRGQLLEAAHRALAHVVATGRPPEVAPPVIGERLPMPLRALRRTFVTLMQDGQLRGCIGSPVVGRSLVEDVVDNACRSAMQDPRFPPLKAGELPRVSITVSILSHDRPVAFDDEAALLAQLRPGVDGLTLRDRAAGALFLPKVWDVLPEPRDFLRQLKAKAGLPAGPAAPTVQATRFTAETFGTG